MDPKIPYAVYILYDTRDRMSINHLQPFSFARNMPSTLTEAGLYLSCALFIIRSLYLLPLPSFSFTHGAAVCRGEKCMCLVF